MPVTQTTNAISQIARYGHWVEKSIWPCHK